VEASNDLEHRVQLPNHLGYGGKKVSRQTHGKHTSPPIGS
jgi:hypothetical protein